MQLTFGRMHRKPRQQERLRKFHLNEHFIDAKDAAMRLR